jgi:hypothetical protein
MLIVLRMAPEVLSSSTLPVFASRVYKWLLDTASPTMEGVPAMVAMEVVIPVMGSMEKKSPV